jgi:DNA-binding NarL/FixJ family response regulator
LADHAGSGTHQQHGDAVGGLGLLPSAPTAALEELRKACPAALVIILISHLDARQQAALSAGADAFISKGETPERVSERLRMVAASVPIRLTALG